MARGRTGAKAQIRYRSGADRPEITILLASQTKPSNWCVKRFMLVNCRKNFCQIHGGTENALARFLENLNEKKNYQQKNLVDKQRSEVFLRKSKYKSLSSQTM
jgi:hypothetical protein